MADEPKPKRSPLTQALRYSEIGLIFPAATVAGLLIGSLLDKWLHTTWLYIVGLLLGIVAGFVNVIRLVMRAEKEE